DREIRPYLWSHRILTLSQKIISFFLFLSFLVSYRFVRLESYLAAKDLSPFLLWICYFAILAAIWELAAFPFSISHHWVERSHQLSKQSYSSWFSDRIKGYLVGAILGVVALGILYLSIYFGENSWWWIACSALVLLSVVLAQLAPVVLIPLFFKLKPLEAGELKTRLLKLSQDVGVVVSEVYHLGMGEKTEKGNAAFVGLGKTKRILIGDTLYEKFSPEEVEAVFAHELGHQVNGDLWKGIILSSLFLYVSFFALNWIAQNYLFSIFETSLKQPFGLLIFFVAFSLFQIPLGLVQTLFSRSRERMADGFAAAKLGSGKALADALEKLTFQNRGLFRPSRIIEFLMYSHPAPWRRINRLRSR
ncbi:MAG: M48 family peptidase, partial [Proteobacteria bacterium]|nr:M48 family peptidase [Pseudomonadota bacterium]